MNLGQLELPPIILAGAAAAGLLSQKRCCSCWCSDPGTADTDIVSRKQMLLFLRTGNNTCFCEPGEAAAGLESQEYHLLGFFLSGGASAADFVN